jgi:glycosyltransferase involved in cell wall biosynthesis
VTVAGVDPAAEQKGRGVHHRARRQAERQADHVICVSENTRKDLLDLLDVSADKVSVVHHGCSLRTGNGLHSETARDREPYLLHVGLRSRYKNFRRLLEVYAGSKRLRSDFKLICFGGPPFTSEEAREMARLGIRDRVTRVAGDDSALRKLYSSAVCFVYPSLYEGFGIPVLEAMSCECPVACSRTSCLPEVAGPAAEYFDPGDCDSMQTAIEAVVYSPDRARELMNCGLVRSAQFSWDECARQTLQVYSSLM